VCFGAKEIKTILKIRGLLDFSETYGCHMYYFRVQAVGQAVKEYHRG
jgi:hypothetical protein